MKITPLRTLVTDIATKTKGNLALRDIKANERMGIAQSIDFVPITENQRIDLAEYAAIKNGGSRARL